MIPPSNWIARRRLVLCVVAAATALYLLSSPPIDAHGVSSKDARFLRSLDGPAPIPLLYPGAKHMVTGYDHLRSSFQGTLRRL